MSLPASERLRWALLVGALALALVAVNLWWIATYRHGYPLTIDEAGYTVIGLVDYVGFRTNGVEGWWDAFQNQAPHAPLVPALTSLVLLIKAGVLEGFGVLIGFLVLLVFSTYGIGERLAGPRLGALAAFAVGTSSGVFIFVREYTFALPAAALLSAAVYALLQSDGLRRWSWAVGCGIALGLMTLARTMTLAFLPGVLLAAAIVLVTRARGDIRRRLTNLGLLVASGVGVAAIWYGRNLGAVLDYLTSYGYGEQSGYYGNSDTLISLARPRALIDRMVFYDLLVPLAALLLLAFVVLAVLALQKIRRATDRRMALRALAAGDAFVVGVVVAAGCAALMSSQNGGSGFTLPISVLLPPLAVIALRTFPRAVVPGIAFTVAIGATNVVSTSNLSADLSQPRLVSIPTLRPLPLVRGTPQAVDAIREQIPGPESRFDGSDRRWSQINERLAGLFLELSGTDGAPPLVAMASRHRAINTNTVQLASIVRAQRGIPLLQLVAEPADSVSTYVGQLADPRLGKPDVLVTASSEVNDFPPVVTQAHAETAARRLGFRRVRTMALPDGRELRIWVRS